MNTLSVGILRRSAADFGLTPGQRRDKGERFYSRSRWYDSTGNVLGWGDLSVGDVERIRRVLQRHELFMIVDSLRDWLDPSEAVNPQQLIEQAPIVISKLGVYFVPLSTQGLNSQMMCSGLSVDVIDRTTAKALIAEVRA